MDIVTFDLTHHTAKISALKPFVGKSGVMAVYNLMIQGMENKNHIISVAIDNDGDALPIELCEKIWGLGGRSGGKPQRLESLKEALRV